MINIYTVKWGNKYSHKHVQAIYESCVKNISSEFKFFCLTEDPRGLSEDINVIPLPKNNTLEKWWNKMYLFDDNVVRQKGEKMFFDLDVIIQRNLDEWVEFDPEDCLCFIKTHWHDMETQYKDTRHIPHKYTDLNSSVLRWNDNLNTEDITLYLNKHFKQILWYYRGIDNFFGHRGVARIKYFPIGWAYSYNQGYIWPHDTEKQVYRQMPYVCLFDSMGRKEDVKVEL
jgi:hypothetical protein